MLNEIESTHAPNLQDELNDDQRKEREQLNRIANKVARRAQIRQQHYDLDHGIFTK
jgi:hypothetical protein